MTLGENTKHMMRHALGLDNPDARGKSYRNRYTTGIGLLRHDEWRALVRAGLANESFRSETMVHFHLTLKGAKAVLKPGETLCPEDFPAEAA